MSAAPTLGVRRVGKAWRKPMATPECAGAVLAGREEACVWG